LKAGKGERRKSTSTQQPTDMADEEQKPTQTKKAATGVLQPEQPNMDELSPKKKGRKKKSSREIEEE